MNNLIALFSGLIFGVGLIVGQMMNPAKVIAFLDVAGAWNPSLALVMAGAIAVALPAFYWAKKQTHSLNGMTMQLPTTTAIDKRLIIGSITFGAGWGLVGFCPAPAIVSAAAGYWQAIVFTVAMLAGFCLFAWFEKNQSR